MQLGASSSHFWRGNALKMLSYFISLLSFFLVLQWIYHDVGDQANYLANYLNAASAPLLEAYVGQQTLTGSSEPVYFLITYAAAKLGIPYYTYKITISLALASTTWLLLSRLNVPSSIILFFLLTNYYWIALYTELERLAIAVAFLQQGVFLWLDGRRKTSLAFLLASIFCHFQIAILFICIVGGVTLQFLISARSRVSGRFFRLVAFTFLLLGTCLVFTANYGAATSVIHAISAKLAHYGDLDLRNIVQAVAAFPLFFYLARGKINFIAAYVFMSSFIFALGGERLNVFLVFLLLFAGFYLRRVKDPVLLISLGYLSAKGLIFYTNIAITGRGY